MRFHLWHGAYFFAADIRDFLMWCKHRAEYDALAHWNGRYYTFDGHHIRLVLLDEIAWIPHADLQEFFHPKIDVRELRLLGLHHATIPGTRMTGVDESGLHMRLKHRTVRRRAKYQMIHFKRWLYAEALPNLRRLPQSSA